jgi:hypothetical protein
MLSGSPPPCSEVLNVQSRPIRNLTPNTQRVYVAQVVRRGCQHQVEPDPAEQARRYGEMDHRSRLARAAEVLAIREPAGRYGGQRD